MGYAAKIITDSLAPCGKRLTTMEVTFPRIVLAEFNTHRQFSRNSASSRAIPVRKMLARVFDDLYEPVFQVDQAGMQGKETTVQEWQDRQRERLIRMRDYCAEVVQEMMEDNVAKGDANRYLEPFNWHTVIVSATEWSNYFAQRCHNAAHPAIRRAADMMQAVYRQSVPTRLDVGGWHLPYVFPEDNGWSPEMKRQLSVARCARVSYLSQDGKRDVDKDIELFARLTNGQHWSPFEHVAKALDVTEQSGNFIGWRQFRKEFPNECR